MAEVPLSPIALTTEQKFLCHWLTGLTGKQRWHCWGQLEYKTPKYTVLESWCFETQEDAKSSKEKCHQAISKYNPVSPVPVCLFFWKEWNSDGEITFLLWKAKWKSLRKGWCPAFSPTPGQTAFCSHCSFTLRNGGKRPKETSVTRVGLPWHFDTKDRLQMEQCGNGQPCSRHSGFEWGLEDTELWHDKVSLLIHPAQLKHVLTNLNQSLHGSS